ncbi:MAG: cell division protein FtsA [Alphaproteobacteria bacterium]|nr:MAG: cell division protein FtsA [Alphaproteobacteria bacterium]TAF41651.1 MAG: cell division protein FtsA [Alphaproteobacteria bacterium]TAF76497.1 MAG: cell division protein FtsA [Alphaproteobacteria bacterium]
MIVEPHLSSHFYALRGSKHSVAVLDIGSNKIGCFIAEPDAHGQMQIIGIGHHHAKGLRGGIVTDSKEAQASIAHAVNAAEKMAGGTLDHVIANVSFSDLASHNVHVELPIAHGEVTDQSIATILRTACRELAQPHRQVVHCMVTQYQLDGAKGIRDPRHMYGMLLKADVHVLTVDERRLMNLMHLVSRCHLDVVDWVITPYAAGLGCLETDEQELGVTVIDMGASTTSVAIFQGGCNIFSAIVPVGGKHVTNDVAKGLSTSLQHAERLKTLYGSVLDSEQDEHMMVDVMPLGDEDSVEYAQVPRAQLVRIIRPRIEEIFELVRDHVQKQGVASMMGRTIVLTGGASQLVGVRELATTMFAKQVRMGKPKLFPGLAESVSSPNFSVPIGMLYYATQHSFEDDLLRKPAQGDVSFGMERLVRWFKERF